MSNPEQSDRINDMIDEAITQLSADNVNEGVEGLIELAIAWARAGLPQDSFANIRKYIIKEAEKNTDVIFIREKLLLVERQLQTVRLT